MKFLRRFFKVFSVTVLSATALIVLSSVVISTFYEKTMISYMRKYLDEHLLTELSMGQVRFRFLKGFPNATIEITDAVLFSGKDFSAGDFKESFADTLLQAKSIFLQFDMLKMLRKEYELKKIEITQGTISVLFDYRNRHNLKIWKSPKDSGKSYSVKLKSIVLRDSRIRIMLLPEKFSLLARSERTNFKGTLTDNILSGEVKGYFKMGDVQSKGKVLVRNSLFSMAINIIYSKDKFEIPEGKFQLNKAGGTISCTLENKRNKTIDLTVNMPRFGLDELMSLIPGTTKYTAGIYEFSGNGKLYIVIKGLLSNRKFLLVKSGFELRNCTARNRKTKSAVNDLNVKGTVSGTDESNFMIEIDTLSARLGQGEISGVFVLHNLKTLEFQSDIHALVDLKAFKDFIGIVAIEDIKGTVLSDFKASGSLHNLSDSSAIAISMIEQGSFVFKDASVKFRNLPMIIGQINGKAFWNNTIRVDSLSLKFNETEILADGEISNLTSYLQKKGLLQARLKLGTDRLDLTKYLNKPSDNKSSTGYKSLSIIPSDVYLKAQLYAKDFIAGKFDAEDLSVNMSALKDSLYIHTFSLRFPDGSISGNGLITVDDQHIFSVTCNAQPQKINIQKLFYSFNNFTQQFILDKNLRGLLGGTVSFYAQWDSTFKLLPSSMKAQGDFQITNGELVQFEPMLKLSKYIDVDELKHIRFKTLKNTIYISDRTVSIPEMAINSSAFNISISGHHSFDNHFDYRLKVLLSEVLFNKARNKKKEIDEFLVEDNKADQPTIPLIIAGTPKDYNVKFDRKKAFNLTHNKLKSSDETIKKPAPENFKVDWEEPVKKEVQQKDEKEDHSSDFKVEWEE